MTATQQPATRSDMVAGISEVESEMAAARASLDQLAAELADRQQALAKRQAAMVQEVYHMLSGDRSRWEVRDPGRVLRRLARFVGVE